MEDLTIDQNLRFRSILLDLIVEAFNDLDMQFILDSLNYLGFRPGILSAGGGYIVKEYSWTEHSDFGSHEFVYVLDDDDDIVDNVFDAVELYVKKNYKLSKGN